MPTQTKTKITVGTAVGVATLTALAFSMLGYAAYSAFVGAGAKVNRPTAEPPRGAAPPPPSPAPVDALTASKTEEPLPVDGLLDLDGVSSYVQGEVIVTLRSATAPQQEALTNAAAIQGYGKMETVSLSPHFSLLYSRKKIQAQSGSHCRRWKYQTKQPPSLFP